MSQRAAPHGFWGGLGSIWNFAQDNGGFLMDHGFVQFVAKHFSLSLYKWFLPVLYLWLDLIAESSL